MNLPRPLLVAGALALLPSLTPIASPASGAAVAATLHVRLAPQLVAREASAPLDGRLLVIFAIAENPEPRFQVTSSYRSAQILGVDVEGWNAAGGVELGAQAEGHPLRRLADLPPGEYWVQALFHRYERVTPSHGKTILVPWDRGEGQQWNRAPGNLLSEPRRVRWEGRSLELVLSATIPPIEPPADTAWVKHIRIRSERLSQFWGRDVELGAHVLLPEGFDQHPEARYPVMIFHGHFPADFGSFLAEPPLLGQPCVRSERFDHDCYNRLAQEEAHRFYREWSSEGFPRFLAVEIQHPTPFYDDSYAVDSANQGPYGDAITHELLPEIERRFRGVGAPWARFLYGGSTGGWEALAAQILYPRDYNGAFGACPDPVDFRSMMLVDLYRDENAYFRRGPFGEIAIPAHRDRFGQISATMAHEHGLERALGSRGRSGGQWDGWQAVYSPLGADGYPAPILDKSTGVIDPVVAAHWREHYDLRHRIERDWATLAADLRGKLHLFVGDMDNYYLNNAVRLFEEAAGRLDPPADFEFAYGDGFEHCWNGDPALPNGVSRLRYHTMYLDRIARRLEATAPAGWKAGSWRAGERLRPPATAP